MTNDNEPASMTAARMAPYERPVLIELHLSTDTDGKPVAFSVEASFSLGPS